VSDHPGYNASEFDEWLADVLEAEPDGNDAPPFVMPEIVENGQRNETLYRLIRSLKARQISETTIRVAVATENSTRCRPPLPDREVKRLVDHALTQDDTRKFKAKANGHATTAPPGETTGESYAGSRSAVIIQASTITPETVTWLWPGRIAARALTNTVGLPDAGKSLLFVDLAARLTTGSPMPPEPHRPGTNDAGRVLILTLEDSLSHTLVPRLIRAGADLALVDFVQMVRDPDGGTSLLTLAEDLDVLGVALTAKPYALVIVDGITGYLGEAKTHNDGEVRRVLMPFAQLLDRCNVAGLSVMHPPKAISNLAYYASGSIAFTAIPRVTLGVATDPNDESTNPRRLLLKIKGNLYGPVPTLAYTIIADGPADVPRIAWSPDPVNVTVADVLDPLKENAEERTSRRNCTEWLRSHLADGPRHSKDVEDAAKAAGFTSATLRRAREAVVDTVKTGQPGARQQWDWILRRPEGRV
jgi:hypothetical protein